MGLVSFRPLGLSWSVIWKFRDLGLSDFMKLRYYWQREIRRKRARSQQWLSLNGQEIVSWMTLWQLFFMKRRLSTVSQLWLKYLPHPEPDIGPSPSQLSNFRNLEFENSTYHPTSWWNWLKDCTIMDGCLIQELKPIRLQVISISSNWFKPKHTQIYEEIMQRNCFWRKNLRNRVLVDILIKLTLRSIQSNVLISLIQRWMVSYERSTSS